MNLDDRIAEALLAAGPGIFALSDQVLTRDAMTRFGVSRYVARAGVSLARERVRPVARALGVPATGLLAQARDRGGLLAQLLHDLALDPGEAATQLALLLGEEHPLWPGEDRLVVEGRQGQGHGHRADAAPVSCGGGVKEVGQFPPIRARVRGRGHA